MAVNRAAPKQARRSPDPKTATNRAGDARGIGRKALGADAQSKAANRKRLRRIEGQIRGLQKMVEENRYCADIITQVASVQEALRGVARNLMRSHFHDCAAQALRSRRRDETESMYDELLALIYTHLR